MSVFFTIKVSPAATEIWFSAVMGQIYAVRINYIRPTRKHNIFQLSSECTDLPFTAVLSRSHHSIQTGSHPISGHYVISQSTQTIISATTQWLQPSHFQPRLQIRVTQIVPYHLWLTAEIIMAALHSRSGHYIFVLFLLFPRLISAVGDWMSTILPHMVWP